MQGLTNVMKFTLQECLIYLTNIAFRENFEHPGSAWVLLNG